MERRRLVETVCGEYCAFFKPGKDEELACRGLLVLQELSRRRKDLPRPEKSEMRKETGEYLEALLCLSCPFSSDGCDFAAGNRGENSPPGPGEVIPCGGFLFLGYCLDQGTIDIQLLNEVI